MNKILVVGSMNMDYTIYCEKFPLDGETIYGKKRIVQPGGKGANQAAAAAKSRLAPITFIGARGDDHDGKTIENLLKSLGIAAFLKVCPDLETGNATIDVSDSGENKIIIIAGSNGNLLPSDISEDIIKEHEYIVLQNEIPQSTNVRVMELAHKYNKKVVYNPAPYRPIDKNVFQYVDYLAVNEVELMRYSGVEGIKEGADVLLNEGVKHLIITLGSDGSMYKSKNEEFSIKAHKVKAVDTVAAGDTYIGYMVASLASGRSIKKSMELASKASALTVTKQGSIVSIPFGEEVY